VLAVTLRSAITYDCAVSSNLLPGAVPGYARWKLACNSHLPSPFFACLQDTFFLLQEVA
jgi:hypothetical protein